VKLILLPDSHITNQGHCFSQAKAD